MEKLITFAVPCYNSAGYMRHCLNTLLSGGEDVEIVVVNDGSTDDTGRIAAEYAQQYPNVTAVNKENGGHGSGVNTGLRLAKGLYFKVVDSDDWLDEDALAELLNTLRAHRRNGCLCDLYVTNFVYDKVYAGTSFTRRFTGNFPVGSMCGWAEVKPFHTSSVLLMHALLYKTDKLRECGLVLPEHTFYVDNIYAYKPFPYIKTLYYLDIDLFHYFIGRDDQSVSADNIVRRYEQQIRVMKEVAGAYSYAQIGGMEKGLKKYMRHYLGVMMTLSMMFTTGGTNGRKAREAHLKELWRFIREKDRRMYRYLRRTYPMLVNWMPFRLKGKVMFLGYRYFRAKLKCS